VSYSFDERGLLTKLDYSNGADLMSYDENGNLLTKVDRNKSLVRFLYDEMGRNIRQEYFEKNSYDLNTNNFTNFYDYIELGYDGRGNLVNVDGTRLTEEMSYDARARLEWVERSLKDSQLTDELANKVDWITASQSFRFSFTYTPNDLVDTMTMPNGKTIQYHYDETKLRLSGIDTAVDDDGDGTANMMQIITGLSYNRSGQVTRMDYANGTSQYWEFDARKRIKKIEVDSNGTNILKLEYKLDTENNIVKINDNTFMYDEADRIIKSDIIRLGNVDNRAKVKAAFGTSAEQPIVDDRVYDATVDFNGDGYIDGYDHIKACQDWVNSYDSEEFTYDHNGNRRSLKQNDKEYIYYYGERNRLLKIERVINKTEKYVIVEYEYDLNGNTIKKTEHNDDGTLTVYEFKYDINNRLIETRKGTYSDMSEYYSNPDNLQMIGRYIYDNAGMRLYKDENNKRTYYFRNGGSVNYEVEIDDAENEVTENTYIISGELIAGRVTRKNNGADVVLYYHLDHLNSTKMVTNQNGAVVLEYEYRAFGTELDKIGSDENRFSYIGREFDEEINLYYVNARYYDATIGRFINVDPIQDGWNWYVYCNNNPLKFVDPSGLLTFFSHGTFSNNSEKYYKKFDCSFVANMTEALEGNKNNYDYYNWSGKNSRRARNDEETLTNAFNKIKKAWESGEVINFVTHSHGQNFNINLLKLLKKEGIVVTNFISLSGVNRKDLYDIQEFIDSGTVKNFIEIYHKNDTVRTYWAGIDNEDIFGHVAGLFLGLGLNFLGNAMYMLNSKSNDSAHFSFDISGKNNLILKGAALYHQSTRIWNNIKDEIYNSVIK